MKTLEEMKTLLLNESYIDLVVAESEVNKLKLEAVKREISEISKNFEEQLTEANTDKEVIRRLLK